MANIDTQVLEELSNINANHTVSLPDGTLVSKLGQGTWHMGESRRNAKDEIEALKFGVDLGLTLIDTAEMYANGGSELIVGKAIKGVRERVFLVSKVYPHNAGLKNIVKSCDESLKRMQTDYMDLYLLHWRGSIPLEETIAGMENLVKSGKILRWGVSNFDTSDMKELVSLPHGEHCSVNQVLYHLGSRGIEYDLIDWHKEHNIPIMAYCPIAQAGSLRRGLTNNSTIRELASKYAVKPIQILLAWCMRLENIIAIPKAAQINHVLENAKANTFKLSIDDLEKLNKAFPRPNKKVFYTIYL